MLLIGVLNHFTNASHQLLDACTPCIGTFQFSQRYFRAVLCDLYSLSIYTLHCDLKYLQIYAGSFFAIPVIRWLLLRKRNGEIERRNQTRLKFAQALELPDISLRRKVNNIVVVLCPAVIILFLAKVTIPLVNDLPLS